MPAKRICKAKPKKSVPSWVTVAFVNAGVTGPVLEHRFHETRKWRFDFAWPELMVAAEYEGGTWSGGRHTTGAGYDRDREKYNEAALLGWTVICVTSSMVSNGIGTDQLTRALAAERTLRELRE